MNIIKGSPSTPSGGYLLKVWAANRATKSKDEHAPHAARVSASQAILDRAYGKAPTFSTTDATQFKRAIDMTDDELAAIIARSKLTVVK